jgi:two-component system, NarL family, sensor histidine kinase DegS
LIEQLKNRQYASSPRKTSNNSDLTPEKATHLFEELLTEDKFLRHSKDELLFAYQTLEVGYQRYWEFFNFAPDGYLVTDTAGIIQEANQTILSMLSVKPTDLIGHPITSLIPEIKHYDFGMQLNWFSGSQNLEVHLQPRDREPFYASLSIAPQCNIQNRPIGLLWLIRNITERKIIEETLRESQTELSLILEQTPYVLWATDTSLNLVSASGANINSGHSPDAVSGLNIAEYFNTENPQAFLSAHQNALRGSPQILEFNWHGRIFQSKIEALRDKKERVTGVIGAAFDISELKETEKTLQKSEKFNYNLLQNSPNPIIVINSDTSIAYVNPIFEKISGYSSSCVIKQKAPYPWWVEDTPQAMKLILKTLARKKHKQERLFRKKNGDPFWIDETTTLIENEEGSRYHLQTWVDITEAKRLRENLEFYVMQITKVQEEERKRIAQALHEETLQSLAALCLTTEAIINSRESNSQETIRNLRELQNKINGVIDEVRRFSYDLRPGVLDYLGLSAALETLADEFKGKDLEVHLKVTGKERALVPDMEITLFRIAQEALTNVKKYSRAKTVYLTMNYGRTRIKLEVSDNGQGFILPGKISELAAQGKSGLIGIRERTHLNGGTFSIQSQPEKGTRLTVTLPIIIRGKNV